MKVDYAFPKDFIWGVASSSYQTEGGWNEGGKGESTWDRFAHIPGNIKFNNTGDVASDFYHHYKEDVQIMSEMNVQSFASSFSWARILPEGVGEVNPEGIAFYKNVFEEMKAKGMTISMSLFHWDLPQALEDKGGWTNRECIDWFVNYAKVCFREFGEYVDYWVTFNEPETFLQAYQNRTQAPGYYDESRRLLAGHHLFVAHGEAVKAFREMNLKTQIGIKMIIVNYIPLDPENELDRKAMDLWKRADLFYYPNAVLKGEYDPILMDAYKKAGVVLPKIFPGDMETMCQPLDFVGFNSYFHQYVSYDETCWPLNCKLVFINTHDVQHMITPYNWEYSEDNYYTCLHLLYDNYDIKKILITESGCAQIDWVDFDGHVHDPNRIMYLKNDLRQIKKAIDDGLPIIGYHYWSYSDNFEWSAGFHCRFGLVYIDFNTLERIPKDSAYWYANTIKNNGFSIDYKE